MPTYPLDAEVVAKLTEMDMLVADLERANSRVAAVERRNVSSSFLYFGFGIKSSNRNCYGRKSKLYELAVKETISRPFMSH